MLREYNDSDYPTISKWATAQHFPILPPEYLPQHGLLYSDTAVGFLYMTDSKISWMEWIITNPEAPSADRNRALNEIVSGLIDTAQRNGSTVIFTSVEHEGLIGRYEEFGFMKTDRNMTNMISMMQKGVK